MVSTEWFRPVHTEGDFPEGATPELLADLYDLLMKFGDEDPKIKLRRLSVTSPREVHCCVVTEKFINIAVSADPGGMSQQHTSVIITSDPVNSFVAWDERVTVDDVVTMIAEVDSEMRKRPDTFDPETGERVRCPYAKAKTKIEVERMFDVRAKVILIPPGADPEEARLCFDKPDEVSILSLENGRPALCRKSDEQFLLRRSEIIAQLLKVRFPDAEGDLFSLSEDEQAILLEMAAKILSKDDK